MSIPVEAGKRWEVRDENGAVVGYVLSAEQLQALQAERDSLRDKVTQLTRQMETTQTERDDYRRSLQELLRGAGPPMTAEELERLRADSAPVRPVLEELEAMLRNQSGGA